MSTSISYQDWLNCLRVGDYVDHRYFDWDIGTYWKTGQIKQIEQLSTNNYAYCTEYSSNNYGSNSKFCKPQPSDSLIKHNPNRYKKRNLYSKFIHSCKSCNYKCIYNNSFIIHRFNKTTRLYLDSYCKECYIKIKYQYLLTLIQLYFKSIFDQENINIDINILSLITKYSLHKITKIECGIKNYDENKICADTTDIIEYYIDEFEDKLLPISIMKNEANCLIPCKSCSKLSLKATQCKLLHGSKYIQTCNGCYNSHDFCTECDSEPKYCHGMYCYNNREKKHRVSCNFIKHHERSCNKCGNPGLCWWCVYGYNDFYCGQRYPLSMCNGCGGVVCGDCSLDGNVCVDCQKANECKNVQVNQDKSFQGDRLKDKRKNKKKRKYNKGKSYWKRRNDRKGNSLSISKWNKRYLIEK